jgi:hypothetical protein
MSDSIKDVINSLPETDGANNSEEYMQDDEYIDGCQEIINEALEKGYDVIHMENGDIITTGTKVIVTQYRWDADRRKMVKVLSKQKD